MGLNWSAWNALKISQPVSNLHYFFKCNRVIKILIWVFNCLTFSLQKPLKSMYIENELWRTKTKYYIKFDLKWPHLHLTFATFACKAIDYITQTPIIDCANCAVQSLYNKYCLWWMGKLETLFAHLTNNWLQNAAWHNFSKNLNFDIMLCCFVVY